MKFAVMQNVLGQPLPQAFPSAKDLGFDGLELDWYKPEDAHGEAPLSPPHRAPLKAAAQSAGVQVHSVCAHFLNRGGLAHFDETKQSAALAAVRAGLELCRDLGARTLVVPFLGDGEINGPVAIDQLKNHLKSLAPDAAKANVILAIETSLPAAEAAALLDDVASPHVAACFDMGNCMCYSYDPVREVQALGKHIATVHAKEFFADAWPVGSRANPRYTALNKKPLGQGQVPIKHVLDALRKANYVHYITLETTAFGDKKTSAHRALKVLHTAAA